MNDFLKNNQPRKSLLNSKWFTAKETFAVFESLSSTGADVRFVGGCIRDTLAQRKVTDIDIGTPDPPETVIRLLRANDIKAIPTGLSHGTITAVTNRQTFQVTTLRRDLTTDGRHAKIRLSSDWTEDAKRRDFTINALSATPDGSVIDPFTGITDLKLGKVIFIGSPKQRIEEDYLRILRYYRFSGIFSDKIQRNDATDACRKAASNLKNLSRERIRDEFLKILSTDKSADVCSQMRKDGIFKIILPQIKNIDVLKAMNRVTCVSQTRLHTTPDPILNLATLLDPKTIDIDNLVTLLRLSKHQSKRLKKMVSSDPYIQPDMNSKSEKELCQTFSRQTINDLSLMQWAREIAIDKTFNEERQKNWLSLLHRIENNTVIKFPLTGKDILQLGVAPGPSVGMILKKVEKWWKKGGYLANSKECLQRSKVELSKLI